MLNATYVVLSMLALCLTWDCMKAIRGWSLMARLPAENVCGQMEPGLKKTTCDTTDLWAILSCCWSVSQPQKRANFQCTKSWRLIVFKINEVSTAGAVCTFTVFTIFDFSTLLLFPGNLCCHTPPYHLSTNQHSHPVTCIWDFAVASLWWMKTSVCTLSKRKPERRLAHFWDNKLCFCYLLASDLYFEMFLKLRNSQVEAIYWGMICLSEHKQ